LRISKTVADTSRKLTLEDDSMKKQNGFSLIELLIVVGIILIIAAIAVPTLTRARVAADESSAVGSVRTINTAEISYNAAYPSAGFTVTLANLGSPAAGCTPSSTSGCFFDATLSSGMKSGYAFTTATGSCTAGTPQNCYSVLATPQFPAYTGARYFCSFEDGVVRYSTAALSNPCTAAASPVQ
jgi:type IV pilus assembly protein PilA